MPQQQSDPGAKNLSNYLSEGHILIADGAAGTLLMASGLPNGMPPDVWNAENPKAILKMHRAYLEAGSQIILTNTFGANRIKLEKSGIVGRVSELNRAGAELARQAASNRAYMAGDIGPTGELMKPYGRLTYDEALDAFREQATALVEGGVDGLWVETMMDLNEAKAAINAVRQVTDLPILCSLTFRKKGRTMMGVSAAQAAEELWPLGLAAIGANCGEGLEMVVGILEAMREKLPEAPLIAKPNAGIPKMVAGQAVYDVKPLDFANRIADFVALGAQVVGACCGSSPEYIREITKLVNSQVA